MAAIYGSGFDRGIAQIQGDLNADKAEDVLKNGQNGRIATIALGILTIAGGVLFTAFSLSTLYATTGVTAIFLLPAAAAFLIASECYKITQIFDVILTEAKRREEKEAANPAWIAEARALVDSTIILRRLLS